jgi:hypothetical protein
MVFPAAVSLRWSAVLVLFLWARSSLSPFGFIADPAPGDRLGSQPAVRLVPPLHYPFKGIAREVEVCG